MTGISKEVRVTLPRGQVALDDGVAFCERFLAFYLERGLGSASKREIDLLVVHLLVNRGALATLPLHELSLLLQVPESRLAGLIYESKLKFDIDAGDELKSALLARLSAASFSCDGGWVMFAIEDKLIRQAFAAQMKAIGHFSDGSFSREVVRIRRDAFVEFLERMLSEDEQDKILNAVKKAVRRQDALLNDISFRKVMGKFVDGAAGRAGELGVDSVAAALSGGGTLAMTLTQAMTTFFRKNMHQPA